ncbi:hypothetical protein CHM34_04520 [Paludifilum halophilum]|uniref:Major facilitator superfamily (MFS) profile domain-containing protein n=2 Tax=Paludifilum halophilum TaxID=1642702 RepID=A0A235B9U7_9BACL|nr:hypothetical protein CHM34_04520 [Paludifilum halophilum]
MSLPFLSIYLSQHTDLNPFEIGWVLGMSGLGAAFGGFAGGYLSDLFGRRMILLLAAGTWTGVFFSFFFADTFIQLSLLNLANGMCRSFFEPTSQALMADLTPESKRLKIFGYQYTALNVGMVLGPLLGAYLFQAVGIRTFLFTGIAYAIYFLLLMQKLSRHRVRIQEVKPAERVRFINCIKVIRKDAALGYFVLAETLFFIVYSQIETNLPIHLTDDLGNSALYPILLTINALVVILLQSVASGWAQHKNILSSLSLGCLLFSTGFSAYAIGGSAPVYISGMVLITLGEILIYPVSSLFIDRLADERLRGTYYGTYNFAQIGLFLGPTLGGWILKTVDGSWMWWMMVFISLHMIWFYAFGYRVYAKKSGFSIVAVIRRVLIDLHLIRLIKFSLKIVPLISLLSLSSFLLFHNADDSLRSPKRTDMVEVRIPEDASLRQIADELEQKGIIRDGKWFPIYAISNKTLKDLVIQPGVYQISPKADLEDVMKIMSRGTFTVEIPPGTTVHEIANSLDYLGVERDRFLKAVKAESYDFSFLEELPDQERPYRLEGYLMPGQYEFRKGVTEKEIVTSMLMRFDRLATKNIRSELNQKGWTVDEWVTVASLAEERPQRQSPSDAAQEIYRRLQQGYVLENALSYPYSEIAAYNTHHRRGLPPGPINNPGKIALKASLDQIPSNKAPERQQPPGR